MLYCKRCGFSLTGTMEKCPFCRGDLTGEPDGQNRFPEIPLKEQSDRPVVRVLALGTILMAAICAAVNYSLRGPGWWSAFVAAGLFSAWIAVGIAGKKRGNPLKAVFWQVCADSLLVLAWDHWTGFRGWSIDFVLPILYICSVLMITVMVRILHLKAEDYLLYLVWDLLLGVIPLVLLLSRMLRVIYPSVVCVLVSVAGLAILVLFKGAALRDEFIRRFHL